MAYRDAYVLLYPFNALTQVVILTKRFRRRLRDAGIIAALDRGLKSCHYPNVFTKRAVVFQPANAGGSIKPGVERGFVEAGETPGKTRISRTSPRMRAIVLHTKMRWALPAAARFAG